MKYVREVAGRWIFPVRRGYRMMCCDCGLVHRLDFRTVPSVNKRGVSFEFRVFRDNRATAAARRGRRK